MRFRSLFAPLLAAAAVVLAACGSSGTSSSPPVPGPAVGQRTDALLPPAVTHADLISSSGRHVTVNALAGKVVVISDFMTLCQETCPLDTANVVAAARAVDRAGLGDEVTFVSITIDPKRDTVAQLAAYRKLYPHAPKNWIVATATPSALAALWKSLGVYIHRVADPSTSAAPRNWRTGKPLSYDLQHSDEVFFLDRDQRERFVLEGAPHVAPGAPIPAPLQKFMDAQGHHNVAHPSRLAWTLPQELQVLSWLTGQRITSTPGG